MLRLALLALRRTFPLWLVAGSLVLLVLAARASAGSWTDTLLADTPIFDGDARQAASLRALARQNVWSVLLVLAPLLLLGAARLGASAARQWLAPTPTSAPAIALLLALGAALGCAAAVGLTAWVAEAATDEAPRGWRHAGVLESPRTVLFASTVPFEDGSENETSVRWSATSQVPGERLRLWVTVAPGGGPVARARFTARAGGATAAVEALVAGRRALELELPVAAGTLELELSRTGSGAPLVLGTSALELLVPVASERRTALALGTRAWLALATGCALALGLGSVLRPVLATGTVLALALGAATRTDAAAWIPGADLPRAWEELTVGLVPAPCPLTTLLGALALGAIGVALYARALRRAEGSA